MRSRWSNLVATARCCLSLFRHRPTVLRSLCQPALKAGGRPPGGARGGGFLVLLDRDDGLDTALAQVGAGGVRLVSQGCAGPGAGPALAPAADADLVHQRDELRAVAVLARGGDPGQRAAAPARHQVDLRGQPGPGAAGPLPARAGGSGILVIRCCPPAQVRGQRAAGTGRMLVRTHHRGIHADRPARAPGPHHTGLITPGLRHLQDHLPGPVIGPAAMPLIHRQPVAVLFRQVPPGAARPGPEQDPIDRLPVISPPAATPRIARQQRRQPLPLLIS